MLCVTKLCWTKALFHAYHPNGMIRLRFVGMFLSGLALSLNRSFVVVYENSWSISGLTSIASFLASHPGRPGPDFDNCIFYPVLSCGRFILSFIRSLRFLVQFIDGIQSLLMVLFYFL